MNCFITNVEADIVNNYCSLVFTPIGSCFYHLNKETLPKLLRTNSVTNCSDCQYIYWCVLLQLNCVIKKNLLKKQ